MQPLRIQPSYTHDDFDSALAVSIGFEQLLKHYKLHMQERMKFEDDLGSAESAVRKANLVAKIQGDYQGMRNESNDPERILQSQRDSAAKSEGRREKRLNEILTLQAVFVSDDAPTEDQVQQSIVLFQSAMMSSFISGAPILAGGNFVKNDLETQSLQRARCYAVALVALSDAEYMCDHWYPFDDMF